MAQKQAMKEMKEESRESTSWDPFGALRAPSGFSDLFEDFLGMLPSPRALTLQRAWTPKVDIKETEKEYVISAALPGIKKEEVSISVRNGMLVISGEHKEEKEEKKEGYLHKEMSSGSFYRSFMLPSGVHPDDVKATQKDGVLTVTVPKGGPAKTSGVSIKID